MEAKWESERVRELVPSATIDLGDRIKRLRASGRDVLNLISGAPEFDTPAEIKREAHAAIDEDYRYMTYSLSAGLEDLRRVIADKLRGENGIDADPDHIIVTVGTKEGIALATQACLDPGDEVLLLTPGWVTYDALVRLAGAVPVSVPLRKGSGRMLSESDLAARVTPRTRAVLLNTPHNPTGLVLGAAELEAIAETARRHDLLVLADETLEYLVYTNARHRSIAALPGMAERTLTFNGFSKAFSMAGWRVGYVHGAPGLVANMLKVHQHLVTCANVVAQKAATVALAAPEGGQAVRPGPGPGSGPGSGAALAKGGISWPVPSTRSRGSAVRCRRPASSASPTSRAPGWTTASSRTSASTKRRLRSSRARRSGRGAKGTSASRSVAARWRPSARASNASAKRCPAGRGKRRRADFVRPADRPAAGPAPR